MHMAGGELSLYSRYKRIWPRKKLRYIIMADEMFQ